MGQKGLAFEVNSALPFWDAVELVKGWQSTVAKWHFEKFITCWRIGMT